MRHRHLGCRPSVRSLRALLVSSSVFGLAGCLETAPSSSGPEVAINVAPLQLPGVTEASYTITVEAAGQVVWTRTNVLSSDYGDGEGALTYVGPCDASVPLNRVTIVLDSLTAGTTDLAGTFQNPTPVFRDFECLENQDTFVEFNLTIMREANQGFFDIAVTFDDIFCSAKLDCLDADDAPLELLFDGAERAQTVVMAFACTAGLNESTTLYLSDVAIRCAGDAEAYSIDPTAGVGNLTLVDPPPMIFGAAVYRGREDFADMDKCYWNTAVGLDIDNLGASCTLTATGTASGTPFTDNTSPAWTRWPVVTWTGPLTDIEGDLICGRHALNGGDGVVATTYTAFGPAGRTFARGCDCATGSCEGVIVADPECGNGIVEGTEQCDGDANCDNTCACMNGYPATAGVCGHCGDGQLQSPNEQCDSADANCMSCQCDNGYPPDGVGGCGFCGDQLVQSIAGEQCDGAFPNCMDCACQGGYEPNAVGGCGFCGDQLVQSIAGEQCDGQVPNCQSCLCIGGYEANAVGGCGFCGDLMVQSLAGEQCDGEGPNCQGCVCAGGYEPDASGGCGFCGDLLVQSMAGEQCDGAFPNCMDCSCQGGYEPDGAAGCGFCGDGFVQPEANEECDELSMDCVACTCSNGSTPNGAGCTPQVLCGNGMHDPGEQCDDMIGMGCMGCICDLGLVPDGTGGCMSGSFCGDLIHDPIEECDGGMNCGIDCTCQSGYMSDGFGNCGSCGDLNLNGPEECDGGANCGPSCTCEGGYMADGTGNCGSCGDMNLNGPEECDGGANCSPSCMCEGGYMADGTGNCGSCGDLNLNGPEECDGGANCGLSCMCENGYMADGTGNCGSCGDLVWNGPEECENGPNCGASCTCENGYTPDGFGNCGSCGDGMLNGTEECDASAFFPGYDNCDSTTCTCGYGYGPTGPGACGTCGDGMVNGPEQCDGGDGCAYCQCDQGWTYDGTGCVASEMHLDVYVRDSFGSPIGMVNVMVDAIPGPDTRSQTNDGSGYAGFDIPIGCWVFDVQGNNVNRVIANGIDLPFPYEVCFYGPGPYDVFLYADPAF